MPTNRNKDLAERSSRTPARYSRALARRIWRQTFESKEIWRRRSIMFPFRSFVAGPVSLPGVATTA